MLSAYCGNKNPILIRHNCATCNYHTFSPTPNNFLRGSGCPLCNGSPSFPEVCILLVVSQFFPKAKREKIGRRECDIVFYVKGKRIGLQYDGSFYHKSSQKDNEFNNIFLEDETSYLIRIREAGCPKLVPHYRLYQVKANNINSKKNLNKTISDIFQVINALLGEEYQPQLTDKIMKKASQQSKRSYHYKLLMDQYITYLCENQATPTGKSANNLQGRITTAIREQRFDNGQMAEIFETKKRLGLYVEERNPNFIYQDMVNFSSQSGILPRQQAGDKEETFLYREIKRCIRNNLFSEQQMQEYKWLCERTSNYPMSADRLYSIYVQFVQRNQRLPSIVNGPDEKSLLSKVNHRLARQSFLPEQQLEIERIRLRFSCKNIKNRIIEEYRSFLAVNDRLPFYKAEGLEGKLEMDMLRYLREHRFTIEECHEILKMRGKYQTLMRRFREHVLYLEEGKAEFAQKQYAEFCDINKRLPVKTRRNRDEYNLCCLILQYLNPEVFPLGPAHEKSKKTYRGKKRRTATETFYEAMAFYREHGRFPLHVHPKSINGRSYEAKLAERITALYRLNRFSDEHLECIDQLRFKNQDKAYLIYKRFFEYIEKNDGEIPKHRPGTDENRLLNNLKNHMRQGHYTEKQLREIMSVLSGTRSVYPASK